MNHIPVRPGFCLRSRPIVLAVAALTLVGTPVLSVSAEDDPEVQKANFEAWQQSFLNWPTDNVKLDVSGMDMDRLRPAPAPGVHPRVWIVPEDLEALRRKASDSKVGPILMENLRTYVAPLAENPAYQKLLKGDASGAKDKGIIRMIANASLLSLIEEDEASGRELAKATATFAAARESEILRNNEIPMHQGMGNVNPLIKAEFSGVQSWQHWSLGIIDHHHIGYAYDFLYNWMTEEERATVRRAIATATAKHFSWAMGIAGPAVHNWGIIHANLGLLALSIEGEEGYDEMVAAWTKQLLANYFVYAVTDSGTPLERGGKNAVKTNYGIPFSRRDLSGILPVKFPQNLMAIPNLRRYVTGYMMHLQVPWRGKMQIYGAWGGNDMPLSRWLKEVTAMKYVFPDDPAIDYVWRCAVGENYENLRELTPGSHEFAGDELIQAMLFAQDYDSQLGLDEHLLSLSYPLDYFSPQRLLAEGRSDWSTEATQLLVHAQAIFTAHPRFGRGNFLLNALGRPWTYYARIADAKGALGTVGDAEHYSTVQVNGIGTGYQNSTGVDYVSNPNGMFVSVDNKIPFSWQSEPSSKPDGRVWEEWRFFKISDMWSLYEPDREIPGLSKSQALKPGWYAPGNIAADPATTDTLYERFFMEYAFRTAGLVRGNHPYALVIDDYRKDPAGQSGTEHEYDWHFIMQPDLSIESQDASRIILKESDGPRRLLIQALQIEGGTTELGYVEDYPGYGWSNRTFERVHGKRLIIPSYSLEPRFKFLLYPFREGDVLPQIESDGQQAQLTWKDQTDTISFQQSENGLTAISIGRDGQQILSINGDAR